MGIIDSTLREGGQTVGVAFSLAEKVAIVRELAAIGIEEIELGIASRRHEELAELLGGIREEWGDGAPRLALWSRCRQEDIAVAAGLDIDVLSLSIPVSDRLLRSKLRRTRQEALAIISRSIRQAKGRIPHVSIGLEDATRAEPEFLDRVIDCAVEAGADRLRIADTVGIGSPFAIGELVARVRNRSGVAVAIHAHNDFGMATANALAALESGAEWADATVLGLGERAGNARLEELVAYLAFRKAMAYDVARVRPLCLRVAAAAGRVIAPQQPVIGQEIFACETGLHLQGLLDDPATYEPFDPRAVGGARRLYFGGKAGLRAVDMKLRAAGVRLPGRAVERVVGILRQQAQEGAPPLSEGELPCFALRVVG